MPKVRAGAAKKWVRRTSNATEEFRDGVANPRTDWMTATLAAAPVQAKAVQAAIAAGSFSKGVQAAGSARWQQKSAGKGADRFGPGVADAESDYQRGVQPYLDVISNLTLPPRGPKGDPANIQRVVAVATALRNKKMGK
jgi:hypothetical protein